MQLFLNRCAPRAPQPLKLLAATVLVALVGSVAQAAIAQPDASAQHGFYDTHGKSGVHGKGGMHGMDGAGMPLAPRQMDRMLDVVSASAEQRAQIKQIAEAARSDLRAQREAGRTLHEQSAALFAQPTIDARAAETLRQQMLAQHDSASKRMLQALLDASRVLTPEQRKLLADRMAQHRALMERHRGERAAIERLGK